MRNVIHYYHNSINRLVIIVLKHVLRSISITKSVCSLKRRLQKPLLLKGAFFVTMESNVIYRVLSKLVIKCMLRR